MNDFNPGEGWREVTYDEWRGDDVPDGKDTAYIRAGRIERYFFRDTPVPPLPTDPGYYLTTKPDYGGGPVVVELLNRPEGQWVDAGDREYLDVGQVEDLLPLVRLEPRAVTAQAVLEQARSHFLYDDARRHLDGLAREFGVEP